MTDFFNQVKSFVLKYQPVTGATEMMGMTIESLGLEGPFHEYEIAHFDQCKYFVTAREVDGMQRIRAQENCPGGTTDVVDKNGDGIIEKGESVTTGVLTGYGYKERPKPNPNEFYQRFQKSFSEGIGRFSSFEDLTFPGALRARPEITFLNFRKIICLG